MPRTNLTVQATAPILNGAPAANALDITMTAADTVNFNSFSMTGNEILIAQNTHASTAYTITVNTVADKHGRVGDLSAYQLEAGDIAAYGPIPLEGFVQTDGKLNFQANNAAIKFGVLQVRGTLLYK